MENFNDLLNKTDNYLLFFSFEEYLFLIKINPKTNIKDLISNIKECVNITQKGKKYKYIKKYFQPLQYCSFFGNIDKINHFINKIMELRLINTELINYIILNRSIHYNPLVAYLLIRETDIELLKIKLKKIIKNDKNIWVFLNLLSKNFNKNYFMDFLQKTLNICSENKLFINKNLNIYFDNNDKFQFYTIFKDYNFISLLLEKEEKFLYKTQKSYVFFKYDVNKIYNDIIALYKILYSTTFELFYFILISIIKNSINIFDERIIKLKYTNKLNQ